MKDVCPGLSSNDAGDVGLIDPEHLGNRPLPKLPGKTSNFKNIGIRKSSHAVSFAFRGTRPPFTHHIKGIIFLGSRKKMSEVVAGRRVASMANVDALCDRPDQFFVNIPMNQSVTVPSGIESSVPLTVLGSTKKQTLLGIVSLCSPNKHFGNVRGFHGREILL